MNSYSLAVVVVIVSAAVASWTANLVKPFAEAKSVRWPISSPITRGSRSGSRSPAPSSRRGL
ncbi:MAG: hypothetical protein BMS9Abin12_2175 [Acidimicrobiia bacterium]|nr:MAG: hypothetical protein BMS9Abin12_2175 [Acidimicrobiia bacterium]